MKRGKKVTVSGGRLLSHEGVKAGICRAGKGGTIEKSMEEALSRVPERRE